MKTKLYILFILLNCLCFSVKAAKPFITLKAPSDKFIIDFQKKALNQMSIELILKSQKFQLLINTPAFSSETKLKYYRLEFKIKKVKTIRADKILDLEYRIYDLKNKKIKKVVRKKGIFGRRFLYHSRFLLYQLFYGKKYVKRNKLKIEQEIKQKKQYSPPIEKKKLTKENKQPINKDNPNKEAKKFQSQTDKLKNEIDEELSNLSKENKNKKNLAPINKNTINNVPNKDLSKSSEDFDIENNPLVKNYYYSLGYTFNSVNSLNTLSGVPIEVSSNFEFLDLGLGVMVNFPNDHKYFLLGELSVSKTLASDNYDISAPFALSFGLLRRFRDYNLDFSGKMTYSSHNFISIKNEGSGLTPSTSKIVWLNLSSSYKVNFLKRIIGLTVKLHKAFIGTTDLFPEGNENAVDGTRSSISIFTELWEHLRIDAKYSLLDLNSSNTDDFGVTDKAVSINMTYF